MSIHTPVRAEDHDEVPGCANGCAEDAYRNGECYFCCLEAQAEGEYDEPDNDWDDFDEFSWAQDD